MSEKFDAGLALRKEVLGDEYVNRSIDNATQFNQPLQTLVTEFCWGDVWQRDGLSKQERSLINLAMISALNRPHELALHVRGRLITVSLQFRFAKFCCKLASIVVCLRR